MQRAIIFLLFSFTSYTLFAQCTVTTRADTTICAGQSVALTTTSEAGGYWLEPFKGGYGVDNKIYSPGKWDKNVTIWKHFIANGQVSNEAC